MLGVTKSAVSCWINAKYYPRIDYIEHMAEIFGCTKSDLIEEHSATMKGYQLTNEEYLIIECYLPVNFFQKIGTKLLTFGFDKVKLNLCFLNIEY